MISNRKFIKKDGLILSKIIIIHILLFTSFMGYSQDQCQNCSLTCLNNDSIKYQTLLSTYSGWDNEIRRPPQFHIQVEISEACRKYLLNQDSTFWFAHLRNKNTDWATNLVLYSFYNREATILSVMFNNRTKWLKVKEREIEMWMPILSQDSLKKSVGTEKAMSAILQD